MIVKAAKLEIQNRVVPPTAPVRVLHLINGEHYAGAERVQDLLAMALPDLGYQIDFACLKPGKFKDVRASKTVLHEMHMRGSFDLLAISKVGNLLRNSDYQVIHAHTPRTLLIGSFVAARWRLPLVYHVHSPVGRDSSRTFKNKLNTWVETRCLRNVDAMICVSGSLANYMADLGHDANKIHVVRNGVPTCPHNNSRFSPSDNWTLGTMALYRPRKGIETLLDALAILNARGVPVHLRAVGGFETPEYESEVKALADNLDVNHLIDWTGFQVDINAQFQQMDLFVLPSLYGEGLPMVVLESMANGVPVVASNVEGIPEAVRDGIDGLIFEPGSAKDMADKIECLIGNNEKWRDMRASAIERQHAELSDLSMARGVASVYDRLTQPG